MDGRTDVRKGSPLCPTGHQPFGAAAQKGGGCVEKEEEKFPLIGGGEISPMCKSIGHRPFPGRCPKTGGRMIYLTHAHMLRELEVRHAQKH